jgi:hypothetical protein
MSVYLEKMYTPEAASVRAAGVDRLPPVKLYMTCVELAGVLLRPSSRRCADTGVNGPCRYSLCEASVKPASPE